MDNTAILLIEDNEGDVRLIERAFETRELPGTLDTVKTGDEALDRLHQRGDFAKTAHPDLVLLDLNLPATDGHEILEEMESIPRLKRIPVIVLTSSQSDEDLIRAYEAGANACLLKPVDPEEFADVIQAVSKFWITTAALPASSDGN